MASVCQDTVLGSEVEYLHAYRGGKKEPQSTGKFWLKDKKEILIQH